MVLELPDLWEVNIILFMLVEITLYLTCKQKKNTDNYNISKSMGH